jgi:tetrahydromethanopterin S-methyltransferase subunit F
MVLGQANGLDPKLKENIQPLQETLQSLKNELTEVGVQLNAANDVSAIQAILLDVKEAVAYIREKIDNDSRAVAAAEEAQRKYTEESTKVEQLRGEHDNAWKSLVDQHATELQIKVDEVSQAMRESATKENEHALTLAEASKLKEVEQIKAKGEFLSRIQELEFHQQIALTEASRLHEEEVRKVRDSLQVRIQEFEANQRAAASSHE